MNAIFLELRKNTFYTLIPVILFFSYSLSYLLRAVILAFLNPSVQAVNSNVSPIRKMGPETINRALSSYEEMVQGNLIRGVISKEGEIPVEGEMSVAPPDTGEGEDMKVTGTLSGHWSFARVTIVEKEKPNPKSLGSVRLSVDIRFVPLRLTTSFWKREELPSKLRSVKHREKQKPN